MFAKTSVGIFFFAVILGFLLTPFEKFEKKEILAQDVAVKMFPFLMPNEIVSDDVDGKIPYEVFEASGRSFRAIWYVKERCPSLASDAHFRFFVTEASTIKYQKPDEVFTQFVQKCEDIAKKAGWK